MLEQRPTHSEGAAWVMEGGRRIEGQDDGRRLIELREGLTSHARVRAESSEVSDEELEAALHALHESRYLSALRSVGGAAPTIMSEWTAPGMAPDTPVSAGAVCAAEEGIRTAIAAARRTLAGARFTYALCRPPGHHAGPAWLGGYCYLNTAGAVVHALSDGGMKRVGILDLDLHYPNGTAAIVRPMSETVLHSLHSWPVTNVPELTVVPGRGEAVVEFAGAPSEQEYLQALAGSLEELRQSAEVLVVSLGYDIVRGDPHGCWDFSPTIFAHVARMLAATELPLCVVQEGGYSLDALAECAREFAGGLLGGCAG